MFPLFDLSDSIVARIRFTGKRNENAKLFLHIAFTAIRLQRMLMCRRAADMLGATFKLTANGAKVL
jgi:hypothetical protein